MPKRVDRILQWKHSHLTLAVLALAIAIPSILTPSIVGSSACLVLGIAVGVNFATWSHKRLETSLRSIQEQIDTIPAEHLEEIADGVIDKARAFLNRKRIHLTIFKGPAIILEEYIPASADNIELHLTTRPSPTEDRRPSVN